MEKEEKFVSFQIIVNHSLTVNKCLKIAACLYRKSDKFYYFYTPSNYPFLSINPDIINPPC